jgi:hypothetical protein
MRRKQQAPAVALTAVIVTTLPVWAGTARAQTDEIQVYDAEIAEPGVFNLMVHNNFTFDGLKTPRFPGGLVPNHTLNGVPEWAWGVTDWFEQGLYLPLYSVSSNLGPVLDGFKLRELFVVPHAADRTFFYGINFEFSYNARHWDPGIYSSEIRPIIGWHLGKFDFIVNPIFDNSWKGFNNLDFVPATRIAYNLSQTWAVAVEEYADFGMVKLLHRIHFERRSRIGTRSLFRCLLPRSAIQSQEAYQPSLALAMDVIGRDRDSTAARG